MNGLFTFRKIVIFFQLFFPWSAWGWSLFFRFRSKSVPQKSAYARGFDLRSNSVPQQVAEQQQQQQQQEEHRILVTPTASSRVLARRALFRAAAAQQKFGTEFDRRSNPRAYALFCGTDFDQRSNQRSKNEKRVTSPRHSPPCKALRASTLLEASRSDQNYPSKSTVRRM